MLYVKKRRLREASNWTRNTVEKRRKALCRAPGHVQRNGGAGRGPEGGVGGRGCGVTREGAARPCWSPSGFKQPKFRDFPGGPGVKTPCFQFRGCGFPP